MKKEASGKSKKRSSEIPKKFIEIIECAIMLAVIGFMEYYR